MTLDFPVKHLDLQLKCYQPLQKMLLSTIIVKIIIYHYHYYVFTVKFPARSLVEVTNTLTLAATSVDPSTVLLLVNISSSSTLSLTGNCK